MSANSRTFRWALAIAGGVVAEVGVFAVMPVALAFGPDAPLYAIAPAAFLMPFVVAWFVARHTVSRRVLHGGIVGAVAALIYIAITIGQPLPVAYVASHFLKVLGGMAGGFIADRQLTRKGSLPVVTL
jgi:hypothetical protein